MDDGGGCRSQFDVVWLQRRISKCGDIKLIKGLCNEGTNWVRRSSERCLVNTYFFVSPRFYEFVHFLSQKKITNWIVFNNGSFLSLVHKVSLEGVDCSLEFFFWMMFSKWKQKKKLGQKKYHLDINEIRTVIIIVPNFWNRTIRGDPKVHILTYFSCFFCVLEWASHARKKYMIGYQDYHHQKLFHFWVLLRHC